jgi:hypothetical protein
MAMAVVVLSMAAMSGCKLTNHRTPEEIDSLYSMKTSFGEDGMYRGERADRYLKGGATFEAAQVRYLSIDWVGDSILLRAYDGNQVVISEVADTLLTDTTTMHYYLDDDGELTITSQKPGLRVSGDSLPHKYLLVLVPRTLRLAEVEIDGTAKLVMDSIRCNDLEMNLLSGSIALNECELGTWELNSGASPFVDATFSRMPNEIEINSMGCVVTLYVPEDAGMTVDMEGMNRKLSSELPIGKKGKKHVIGDGACQIECNAVSGSLSIKKKDSKVK